MINSHNELVDAIMLFTEKMPLINDIKYLKDAQKIVEEVNNSEPRILVISLDSMSFDRSEYNVVASYNFVLADEVVYDDAAIINSESENIFCVTSLVDYLNHITDGDVVLSNVDFTTEQVSDSAYTTVAGDLQVSFKASASYWKQMETYNA